MIAVALLIGGVAFPGAFLAKALVARLPVHVTPRCSTRWCSAGRDDDRTRSRADENACVPLARKRARGRDTKVGSHGHFTTGGSEERIESTLPPVRSPKMVPRS